MKKLMTALLAAALVLGCCVPALGETTKHERVYVVAGPDGEIRALIDNILLENADGLAEIADASRLADIENMSGREPFTREGEALIWQADGNDIIYQGTSDRVPAILPVVSLTLDGAPVSAAELKEKTGEAELRVTFLGDGSLTALAVTLMPLPADGLTDLRTENAVVLSQMGVQVLVGYAVPGAGGDLGLPDHIAVSFHADHADLSWLMTFISSDPIRLACEEIDARLDFDLRGTAALAASMLTALKNGEDLPRQPGFSVTAIETNLVVGRVNDFFHTLDFMDNSAHALRDSAAGTADSAQSLLNDAKAAKTDANALRTDLSGLQADGDALSGQADALMDDALRAADAQLAAMGLPAAELTAETYAASLDAAALEADEETAARLTELKSQLDRTAAFVSSLKAYIGGVAGAARSADALNTAVAAVADEADALKKNAAALKSDAAGLQRDGTAKVKSTINGTVQQLAALALPYVQNDLPRILDLYDQARDQARNGGFDLRPEGMQAVTVYIIRTDLQ